MEPADEVGREGREQGKEEEGRRETEQNKKIGYVGKGGGVAVWRFQFLPFARKATPCLTLTDFDFRLAKKGRLCPPINFDTQAPDCINR